MLARTPAAQKKRRYRKRLRDGAIVLHPEVNEHAFAEALLLSGRLDERALQVERMLALDDAALTDTGSRRPFRRKRLSLLQDLLYRSILQVWRIAIFAK
jgi:hypothetical protein